VQNVQYLPGPDWKAITADAAPSSTLSLPAICSSFSPNWGGVKGRSHFRHYQHLFKKKIIFSAVVPTSVKSVGHW
jgi:hypothetical protein